MAKNPIATRTREPGVDLHIRPEPGEFREAPFPAASRVVRCRIRAVTPRPSMWRRPRRQVAPSPRGTACRCGESQCRPAALPKYSTCDSTCSRRGVARALPRELLLCRYRRRGEPGHLDSLVCRHRAESLPALQNEADDFFVHQPLLAMVRYRREAVVQVVEFLFGKVEARLLRAFIQRVAAAVFAEHQFAFRHAHRARIDDLVRA